MSTEQVMCWSGENLTPSSLSGTGVARELSRTRELEGK